MRGLVAFQARQQHSALEDLKKMENLYLSGMELKINVEEGFLRVLASGLFSLESAKLTFLQVIEAIKHHKTPKVLFNCLDVTGEPLTMERFYYGDFCASECLKLLKTTSLFTKFAFVLVPPVADSERFGETVAVNRGMNVKVFEDTESAVSWLGVNER